MFSLGYWCYFLPLLALYIQLTGSKHNCCFLKSLKIPSSKPSSMSFTESNGKSPHINVSRDKSRSQHCNHNAFDSGLSLVPLWMRTLAPSVFPSPPLSKNSKPAASIHSLTARGCDYRVSANTQRNTRYDLNCLQNKICILQISIFPVDQKTWSNVVKNSARAVESLESTNFVIPFLLVCAQRSNEFDATPPIFQKGIKLKF